MEFDGTLRNIQLILSLMILGLCVFGGVTLLAHPRRSRAKSILGAGMLLWAVLIVFRLAVNPWLDSSKPLFQPLILIIGGFGMAVTTCYIIEILRPGFLTFRRFILFLSPVIVCSLLSEFITFTVGKCRFITAREICSPSPISTYCSGVR